MNEPPGRSVVVINGRVHEIPAPRSVDWVRLERSVAWWASLALLGGLLILLGIFVGADLGLVSAIGGVALFFATAALAGDERYELATAAGVAGVVWTSSGIAVDLGTDPSLTGSLVVFAVTGAVMLLAGVLGARNPGPSKHLNTVGHRMRRAGP